MSELYQDLLKDVSESFEDGNYFLVTITELELGTAYPLQFQWKYKDGTVGKDWSAVYNITTPIKTNPGDPSLQAGDVVGGAGFIKVTWDGNDASGNPLTDIDRIDVHISGTSFGNGTKPAGSFNLSGTQTFSAEPGVYIVQLKAVTVNGATSFFSSARTVTVTAVGPVVQSPTLPSGLSVATAPFAVTVNWAGTYSSSTFTGFKSIDIYAVSSDLGSSATSGITNTNLVGSLTVNNIPNKINISLDNLRQALGLSTNSDVYNATIFYYFNATNTDGTKFGSPTYTRINASSVIPTKANFIDLASGVISIENLVAGNGNFSSWLRTGTAGGARIELSAVNDFADSGNTVQKGLTAYSSGSTEVFKLDLDTGALTINGSGTFSGNLSAAGGTFSGTLSAASGSFNGTITANGGTIGGITIAAAALQNNSVEASSTFKLDSAGKARFGAFGGASIIIDPTIGIFQSTNGSSANGRFTLNASGDSTISGWTIGTNSISKGATLISTSTADGFIQIGTASPSFVKVSSDGIQLGHSTFGSAPFRVTTAGVLTATNADITGAVTATSGSFTGAVTATSGTIGGWSVNSNGYLTNNSDTWLHPTIGYTTGGYSSSNFSIISTRGISGSSIQATSSSDTSIQTPGGITLSGNISSVGNITTTGSISVTGNGVINSNGLITAFNGINISTGGMSILSGNVTFGATPGQIMEYLTSNGNLRIGSNITRLQADGQIFANTLGVAPGTPLVQSATGFIKVQGSSRRYKENIVEINKFGYLNTITQLKPVTFNYKQDVSPDDYHILVSGLIAEDVDEIENLRTLVNYNIEGIPESISYDKLSALIVLAVKEIKDRLETIEQRLDALEG